MILPFIYLQSILGLKEVRLISAPLMEQNEKVSMVYIYIRIIIIRGNFSPLFYDTQ